MLARERVTAPAGIGGAVQAFVGLGRTVPREVLVHRLDAHLLDVVRTIMPGGERPPNDVVKGVRRQIVEHETASGAGPLVVLNDGVGEAARRAHDRKRTVAQAVELVEPTWLESRGHQEEIGTCFDAVCAGIVESDVRAEAVRAKPGDVRKKTLGVEISASQEDDLDVEIEHAAQNLSQYIHPFLGGEATHEPEDGHIVTHRKTGLGLKGTFAFGLAGKVLSAELSGDMRIGLRAPHFDVDSIQHAEEVSTSIGENTIEAEPMCGGLNLARVGR